MKSLTIKEAIFQIKKGLLSAQELCQRCQSRLGQIQNLNIFVNLTPKETLTKEAQTSDLKYASDKARPLEGIPLAFKDNFCTRGVPTTCGSRMLLNYVPPYSATMVERCLENGAISVGKSNLDEFAMGSGTLDSYHGPTINPWNLTALHPPLNADDPHPQSFQERLTSGQWYIAGGSSGGSAAAVAVGACLGAFGSDTGGSTRNPASYCGVVGFKPTYGLLSRHGLIPLVNSMDVPGILTKTVEDCSILLNTVAGHDERDSTTLTESHTPFSIEHLDISKLHIGIPKEFHAPGLSHEVLELWKSVADQLEQAGAKVSQVSLPHTMLCIIVYHVLCACEVASNFSRYDGIEYGLRCGSEESTEELFAESRHHGFNDVVRGRILAGNFFLLRRNYERFFIKAQKVRRLISDDFKKAFGSGVDFILAPNTLTDAPLFSDFSLQDNRTRCEEQDIFTTPVNMAGLPAISLPLKLSQNKLPLSLQLVGSRLSESKLLSLAFWLEQEANFPHLSLESSDILERLTAGEARS